MGDLSEHFSRKEFACRCGCGKDTVDFELILLLELIRKEFRQPVFINSGARCESYNKLVGGSANSQHIKCKAADIYLIGVSPKTVYDFVTASCPATHGVGLYKTFVHVDVRKLIARW